ITNNGTLQSGSGAITMISSGSLAIASIGTLSYLPSSTANGNGGSLSISVPNGALSVAGGLLSANAVGTGNFSGGTIAITAQSLSVTGSNSLSLSANSTGSGNG